MVTKSKLVVVQGMTSDRGEVCFVQKLGTRSKKRAKLTLVDSKAISNEMFPRMCLTALSSAEVKVKIQSTMPKSNVFHR